MKVKRKLNNSVSSAALDVKKHFLQMAVNPYEPIKNMEISGSGLLDHRPQSVSSHILLNNQRQNFRTTANSSVFNNRKASKKTFANLGTNAAGAHSSQATVVHPQDFADQFGGGKHSKRHDSLVLSLSEMDQMRRASEINFTEMQELPNITPGANYEVKAIHVHPGPLQSQRDATNTITHTDQVNKVDLVFKNKNSKLEK